MFALDHDTDIEESQNVNGVSVLENTYKYILTRKREYTQNLSQCFMFNLHYHIYLTKDWTCLNLWIWTGNGFLNDDGYKTV